MNTFAIIEVLFFKKQQKEICIVNMMCGLAYFYKLRRILEEFAKLPPPLPSQGLFVVDIWL